MPGPHVDRDRLLARVAAYAEIGATPGGGVTRLALTDDDLAARQRFRIDAEALGMTVRVDDVGTTTARLDGRESLPPMQMGSHLDSVRAGGKFDGALGVLGALEVIAALRDARHTLRHPIEVIDWTNEEGVRFEPAMMGSGVAFGAFDAERARDLRDRDGIRLGDELARLGLDGGVDHRPKPGAAYLELHIEQGPVLDDAAIAVGIVEGILGITWIDVRIDGQADHAGPSPMATRRDALAAAAEVISAVERITIDAGVPTVGTVGRLALEPDVINTVPGRVRMSIDLRHQDTARLEALVEAVTAEAKTIAARRHVEIAMDRFWTSDPTPFDPRIVEAVAAATEAIGVSAQRIWSGAGHDAKHASDAGPAGMIFVRSRAGLSHCEEEHSDANDIAAGAEVLLRTVLALDETLDAGDTPR